MTSRIISGNRTAEDIIRTYYEKLKREAEEEKKQPRRKNALQRKSAVKTSVTSLDDCLVLKGISCIGADNQSFEGYEELYLVRDVIRHQVSDGKGGTKLVHKNFTSYQAVVHFEQQQNGLFLPSYALSCNIAVALFKAAVEKQADGSYKTLDEETQRVLDQYKDHGAGYGWHAQNTVIDWKNKEIIHYPGDSDFPASDGTNNINQLRPQKKFLFDRTGFADTDLEDALKISNFKAYLQNLTGLQNPSALVEVGNYFGKTAKVWVSSSNETRAAWFGCSSYNLILNTYTSLVINNAARGVRLEAQKI